MPKRPRPQGKPASSKKAARAVQRAIRKDNPAKEPPIVGKPVIVDPEPMLAPGRRNDRKG
jgi:hypothetical protein